MKNSSPKKIITLLVLFSTTFLFNNISAQTNIQEGYVSGSWTSGGSPYLINGNITLHEDSALHISPGTKISFMGRFSFTVNGKLDASGAINDSITFEANDPSKGWLGIQVNDNSKDSIIFSFCTIKNYYFGGSYPQSANGAITITNCSKIMMSNCDVSNNFGSESGAGIKLINSIAIIQNNQVNNN
jgi:hypothetical protein